MMLYFAPFHSLVAKGKTKMKRTFFLLQGAVVLFAILVVFAVVSWSDSQGEGQFDTIAYYFPANFQGCATIFYDVAGSAPLEIVDGRLAFQFNENETVYLTSSPQTFGWASEEQSGSFKTEIYIGKEQIPGDTLFMTTGAYESEELRLTFTQIFPQNGGACEGMQDDIEAVYREAVN